MLSTLLAHLAVPAGLAPIRFTPQAIATSPSELLCLVATATGAQLGLRLANALPGRAVVLVLILLMITVAVNSALNFLA